MSMLFRDVRRDANRTADRLTKCDSAATIRSMIESAFPGLAHSGPRGLLQSSATNQQMWSG